MSLINIDPNLNTILVSIVITLTSLICKEHKFLKNRIRILEKKIKKLQREVYELKRKHS